MEDSTHKIAGILTLVFVVFLIVACVSCGNSSNDEPYWSSEKEKANAEWAYEAKKFIDSQN